MKDTAWTKASLQSRRGRSQSELVCLDEAVSVHATRKNRQRSPLPDGAHDATWESSSAVRLGGAQSVHRRAKALEGALSQLANESSSDESSIGFVGLDPAADRSLSRGATQAATLQASQDLRRAAPRSCD